MVTNPVPNGDTGLRYLAERLRITELNLAIALGSIANKDAEIKTLAQNLIDLARSQEFDSEMKKMQEKEVQSDR